MNISIKQNACVIVLLCSISFVAHSQSTGKVPCKKIKDKRSNFHHLTSFSVKAVTENTKIEYSYVLIKGSKYRIQVCSDEGNEIGGKDVKIDLFDYKRALIASTDKKVFLDIAPEKSGICYIQFSLKIRYSGRITSTIYFARIMNVDSEVD